MVVRADGKTLGYIPREALDGYEDFNRRNLVCPFAGKVTVDRKGFMRARILIAQPFSRDYVKKELSTYIESQNFR